ncbi:beta-propeller domain-containing protein [Agaribacter flavus]|uniref:Beta-propeller domain-containing protein n=1 Tax=Agaribacter flavus TaxID=1902781 RepID=A0ABV7FU56_9ALTE
MQQQHNLNKTKQLFGMSILSLSVLSACSGGSDSGSVPEIELVTSPPEIVLKQNSGSPLQSSGANSVSLFVKNGIYLNNQQQFFTFLENDAVSTPASSSSRGFSQTNTQETGVDEADRVEYNGEYVFAADVPIWYPEEEYAPKVRILQRLGDDSLNQVADLDVASSYNVGGLYLADDKLAVITQSAPSYPIEIFRTSVFFPGFGGNNEATVDVDIYGLADPAEPSNEAEISIEGSLINSRRIGNTLFLITQYMPIVEGLVVGAQTDEELVSNYNTLLQLDDEALIPTITVNDNEFSLFSFDDCVIPADTNSDEGNAQLLTVIKIDLDKPEDFDATCLSAVADNIYMSPENLYLTSGYFESTNIHKVNLSSLSYKASGVVDGILGGRGAPNLRLSEHDDHLRVLTTDYSDFSDPEHQLYILNESSDSLEVVGQLPNDAQPEPIGKEGEDVFAVRYFGDQAYVVTFEQIDPLYVLDLSDHTAPEVAGSLEIPGFSSYLHPIGENLVLGIGQEVNQGNLPRNGEDVLILPTTSGMKASLFDVSDPSSPIVRAEQVWENSYTPVEFDYRALSVLQEGDTYKFAMPVETWIHDDRFFSRSEYSLVGLQVDVNAMTMEQAVRLTVEQDENELYIYGGEDRSIIHGDNIYYLRGNSFWHGTWSIDSKVTGPY